MVREAFLSNGMTLLSSQASEEAAQRIRLRYRGLSAGAWNFFSGAWRTAHLYFAPERVILNRNSGGCSRRTD